jgi:hypothetical protein
MRIGAALGWRIPINPKLSTTQQTNEPTDWVTRRQIWGCCRQVEPIVTRQRPAVVCSVQTMSDRPVQLGQTQRFLEGLRVLVVGGISAGVILIGVGSRLAMLLLRVTSPDRVRGVKSDDGFIIGQVTLAGTYNLLLLGASFGIIGAAVYLLVAPWLIGPNWFRRLTTGLAAAVVGGSMLVHADGIDFTVLKPAWLAIGAFIVLPGLFGGLVGAFVDAVKRPNSWTAQGRWQFLLPVILVGCFPLAVLVVLLAAAILGAWILVSNLDSIRSVRRSAPYALAVRAAWLVVAIVGLVAIVNDTQALAEAMRR